MNLPVRNTSDCWSQYNYLSVDSTTRWLFCCCSRSLSLFVRAVEGDSSCRHEVHMESQEEQQQHGICALPHLFVSNQKNLDKFPGRLNPWTHSRLMTLAASWETYICKGACSQEVSTVSTLPASAAEGQGREGYGQVLFTCVSRKNLPNPAANLPELAAESSS